MLGSKFFGSATDAEVPPPYISCKTDSVLMYFLEAVVMCILLVGMHDTEDVVCSFCLIEQ